MERSGFWRLQQSGLRWVCGVVLCLGFVATGHSAPPTSQPSISFSLPMWTRAKGFSSTHRQHLQQVRVNASMFRVRQLWDHQYKRSERYLVVPLASLLGQYKHKGSADIALLHFANGMLIPYPLAPKARSGRGQVYLAVARWSTEDRIWTRSFPPVGERKTRVYRDVQPLAFTGHKLVLPRPWHPLGNKGLVPSAKGFRPWRFANSLTSVVFSTRKAHRRPFLLARNRQEAKGQVLFFQICQFCHGVNQVGAGFGVDFVSPHPVYRHRRSMSLLWHLRYRSLTSIEHGAMMPAIRGMTRRDASALWYWLRAAAQRTSRTKPSK